MIEKLRDLIKVQGEHGNWDYDAYMHGMYNGMELMLATLENREPQYREAPKIWLADCQGEETPIGQEIEQSH